MKTKSLLLFVCLLLSLSTLSGLSQDEPRAAWQVTRFDINVDTTGADRALKAHATLTLKNVGTGGGRGVTLRISPKAEATSARAGESTLPIRTSPEPRGNLQRLSMNLPSNVAPGSSVTVTIDYALKVESNDGLTALSPLGDQFLPASSWYPQPNTAFAVRGGDVAPFKVSVNSAPGEQLVSSGKTEGNATAQSLFGTPFFVTGNWDVVEGSNDARGILAYLPQGATDDERKVAQQLIAYAQIARALYGTMLGPVPDSQIKLVTVQRGAGFSDGGTLLVDRAVFRRSQIDAVTAMQIGEAVAKLWIGGQAAVRGEGSGAISEGLTRYFATLAIEKQFGKEAALAEEKRERDAYSAVARRDAPLAITTPFDSTYYTTVSNKGAVVWRLIDHVMGTDAFAAALKARLQSAATSDSGLRLADLRDALSQQAGASAKTLFDLSFDRPTEMDLQIGIPQQKGGQWVAAVRNTGKADVNVPVVAVTDSGQRITFNAAIPAESFGDAVFGTTSHVARVEIDPDKLFPQLDYSNDVAPRAAGSSELFSQANALFAKQDFAGAEAKLRSVLAVSSTQEAHVLLARSLLGENKLDDAEKEFTVALKDPLPLPLNLGWSSAGLGEIALRRGQPADAVRRFSQAVNADAEYGATLAGRLGRIKAEQASPPAIDASIQSFIGQLDTAIKAGHKADMDTMIVPGELTTFVKGIVGSQPEIWQTKVVRTEIQGSNRGVADVFITARQLGKDVSGTAVLFLAKINGSWKLNGIEYFEVR